MIAHIGLGTMQWDYLHMPRHSFDLIKKDYRDEFQGIVDIGINFFDTPEVYGNERSDSVLEKYYKEIIGKIVSVTKFLPFQWRISKCELRSV